MHPISAEILANWQTRKTKKQKAAFEAFLLDALRSAGYTDARVEENRCLLRNRNIIAGDPDTAKVIYTAHYDTCAVMPFPNFITPTKPLVYVLYQLLIVAVFFLTAFLAVRLFSLPFMPAVLRDNAHLAALAVLWLEIFLMLGGKASTHTANDNTSGVITLVETALALPPERRGEVCFVWFDNEESGVFGSCGFAAKHKRAAKETAVLNFDCVSDGDHMLFVLPRKLKDDPIRHALQEAFGETENISAVFTHTGKAIYPSDQAHFKRGIGIAALKKGRIGLYMDRIHTKRDTVFMEKNIEYLAKGAAAFADSV